MSQPNYPQYLREKQVAKLLNVSVYTLQKHRQKRIGLPSIKLHGMVLYAYSEIQAYLSSKQIASANV